MNSSAATSTRSPHADSLRNWDDIKRNNAERVLDHSRAEWAPLGIVAGSFLYLPVATLDVTYDDDRETPGGGTGDFEYMTGAGLTVHSLLPRHILDVMIGGRFVSYQENDHQNHENGYATVAGRIDIDAGNAVFADLEASYSHLGKFDPDNPVAAAEPVPICTTELEWRLRA